MMLIASLDFAWNLTRNIVKLLQADGQLWKPHVWWQALPFLFRRNTGFVSGAFSPWLAFFRKGFHPSEHEHDDSELIAKALAASYLTPHIE